ncbi:MAG: hypothetical protein GZ091_11415 [Paludibacter sp.]|nr:hypothetical protein [Paludibacter sp.]
MENFNDKKRKYSSPLVKRIELDKDISLQLQSVKPPLGPGEPIGSAPEYLRNDPFKMA